MPPAFSPQSAPLPQEPLIPEATQILLPTFVALCLGALVGLERQVAQEESGGLKDFPGVRTLAFTALLGALAVLVSREIGQWLAVALFLASATFLVLRYQHDTSARGDPGYTTETASLCTFVVGALAQSGQLLVATVITIAMVALLRSKRALHRAGELLSPTDMELLIRFLVIAGIILPLLPDQAYDPYGVLRPRDVWRMVVLISGLSFAGYVLMRLRVRDGGHLLNGLLGGLVSATAATFAHARSARLAADTRAHEARVVLAVSTSFVRMSIVVAAVAPALFGRVAPTLAAMFLLALALGVVMHRSATQTDPDAELRNPLTLRHALGFAALYASVLLFSAAARETFAAKGTYTVTALVASVGADAPVIALGRLASGGLLDLEATARGVCIVAVSATLGKLLILLTVARRRAVLRAAAVLALVAAVGALVTVLA
ncbi:MAG: DUF4010 domain-containing protein [Myxococcota bacterium]